MIVDFDSTFFELACKDKQIVKSVMQTLKKKHLNPKSRIFKAVFKFHILQELEKKMLEV